MPLVLVHAPVGTVLIRQGVQSFVLALALREGGDAPLPITSMTCYVCGNDVNVLEEGTVGPRVNGDSRFGYEAVHIDCDEREAARYAAMSQDVDGKWARVPTALRPAWCHG